MPSTQTTPSLHPPSLAQVRSALRNCPSADAADFAPERKHSAVALILGGAPDALSLAFIRRAEREGDPWSGHIAFPGGRAQASDPSAQAVAERETEEETGLSLAGAECLAYLGPSPVNLRGRATGMVMHAFVFHVPAPLPPLLPSDEVAEGFWVPLPTLFDPAHGVVHEVTYSGETHRRPGIAWNGHTIWGLTWRTLDGFAARLGLPLAGTGLAADTGYRPPPR